MTKLKYGGEIEIDTDTAPLSQTADNPSVEKAVAVVAPTAKVYSKTPSQNRNTPGHIPVSDVAKVLTRDEEQKIRNYLDRNSFSTLGMTYRLVFLIMLDAGLRPSEVCKLRVRDTAAAIGENVLRVWKNRSKLDRVIGISAGLAELIKVYVEHWRPLTLPENVRPSDKTKPLFYSKQKNPYERHVINLAFAKITRDAGIERYINPFVLRHTFYSQARLVRQEGAGL